MEYGTETLIAVGLVVSIPFVILLLGTPVALIFRALLWAVD